jgi:hypothetical protein
VWKEPLAHKAKQAEKAKRRNSVVFQNFLEVSVFDDEDSFGWHAGGDSSQETLKWKNHKGVFGVLVGGTLSCYRYYGVWYYV